MRSWHPWRHEPVLPYIIVARDIWSSSIDSRVDLFWTASPTLILSTQTIDTFLQTFSDYLGHCSSHRKFFVSAQKKKKKKKNSCLANTSPPPSFVLVAWKTKSNTTIYMYKWGGEKKKKGKIQRKASISRTLLSLSLVGIDHTIFGRDGRLWNVPSFFSSASFPTHSSCGCVYVFWPGGSSTRLHCIADHGRHIHTHTRTYTININRLFRVDVCVCVWRTWCAPPTTYFTYTHILVTRERENKSLSSIDSH